MIIERRQGPFSSGLLNLLSTILLTVPAIPLDAQTVEIKLLDGRNGRPMVGASSYVNVWVGGERKEAIAIPTNDSGVARLQLTFNPKEVNVPISTGQSTIVEKHPIVEYSESLRINAPYVLCGSEEVNHSPLEVKSFNMVEVLDHGYASGNTCGKVKASPQPGQVFLFVRPLTFSEKMKQ